ncbi:LOW QUALITY PROTEIN: nuclear transcription factor, X-box binding stc [Aphomia sociella]
MSQWNNSYVYNNQYQGANGWNGDLNDQYANEGYYPTRQHNQTNQYVSFNEFLSQMQGNNAPNTSNSSFNNAQYQNYEQYNYPSMPSTSQNTQHDGYYRENGSSSADNYNQIQHNAAMLQADPNMYTDEMILKSNLTPTAMEFVPKSSNVKPSSSVQNIPESSHSSHNEQSRENKKNYSSSSDTNWRERPKTAQQNGEMNHKNELNNRQENYRNHETRRNRNSYQDYGGRYETGNHSQETNNRGNDRNQSKSNSKIKNKEADAGRTFYNSAHNKGGQEPRSMKEGSGRGRNWVGSQRVRPVERNTTEDEQYANSYLHYREEMPERQTHRMKSENTYSPAKFKSKNIDQVHSEMTQRERLSEQLDKGTLECLVCCERVKQTDSVWSCSNCYHVLHLRCIRKWAVSSMVEGKWRCPACQNTSEDIPTEYRCMCGAVRSPEYQRGSSGAHTCGKSCKRLRTCPHPCTLLCHPGPCPPCQATIRKECGCGAETRSILCSSKLPQLCDRPCQRTLQCGAHTCSRQCHEGPCDPCGETVTQVCHCPAALARSVACTARARGGAWSCGEACGRVLACGAHVCARACHPPPCAACALLPAAVITCPCGKTQLEKDKRKSCTDPIPLCGNICAKPLSCGPAGDKHFCKLNCHDGPCPVCPDKTLLQCRCGHSSREVPCADLPEMYNNVLCQKKCNKKLSCGRHRCRSVCCAATSHRCAVVCGRSLTCQLHRCEEFCHTGHCAPCPRLSFDELRCSCGAEVSLPPLRCGARPPACAAPCRQSRECGHEPHHSCHTGDCPPCVVLTTKRCHGGHEERKTIPCSQEEFSCGLPCGKPLPCGKHTCIKTCHKGPCDTAKCTQACTAARAGCGHACAAPCHAAAGTPCPSAAPCRRHVRAVCACGRRSSERACADNARDYAKMMSALAATKMQEGGSVDISGVQRPGSMLKTLECDDECRMEARSRQLALALQIRNPDVSAKLAPRYGDLLRATAVREPAFAQLVHDRLTDLVQLAKKSKQKTRSHSFPSMNRQKRQFIHELCEHFGCESVAYDAEPNRNVVATADKEKSWLPAMSVLEVVAREAGKRRVPGPVLRAAPLPASASASATSSASTAAATPTNSSTAKSSGGWATLTSTNAWAARSQSKPASVPAKPKIDYFDNPPDN